MNENSYANAICRPCIATDLLRIIYTYVKFAALNSQYSTTQSTSSMAVFSVVDDVASLSPHDLDLR